MKKFIKYIIVGFIVILLAGVILAPRNKTVDATKYRLYKYHRGDELLNHFELYDHYYIEFNNDDSTYTITYKKANQDEHVSSGTFTKTENSYICGDIEFTIDSSKIISASIGTDKLEFKLE